jgi:hypothetical protein
VDRSGDRGSNSNYLNCFAPFPHWKKEAFAAGIFALLSVTQQKVATLLRNMTVTIAGFQLNWWSVLVASPYCHSSLLSIARYLWLAIWPLKLSADYSYSEIPLARRSFSDWTAWIAVVISLGVLVWLWRRSRPAFFFAIDCWRRRCFNPTPAILTVRSRKRTGASRSSIRCPTNSTCPTPGTRQPPTTLQRVIPYTADHRWHTNSPLGLDGTSVALGSRPQARHELPGAPDRR